MKINVVLLFCLIFSIQSSKAQDKFTLQDLIHFTQFKTNKDFESIIPQYQLHTSNLVDSLYYDEIGFLEKTKLKKFNRINVGDSFLYNKRFRFTSSGKMNQLYNNHLSIYKRKDGIQVEFNTTSLVNNANYFDEIVHESDSLGFTKIQSKTSMNDGLMTQYKAKKDHYILQCTTTLVNQVVKNTKYKERGSSYQKIDVHLIDCK